MFSLYSNQLLLVGFTTAYAISAYHSKRGEFECRSWRDILDTTLCDKVCQVGCFLRVFRFPISSTNKTDRHKIAEILFKVTLTP